MIKAIEASHKSYKNDNIFPVTCSQDIEDSIESMMNIGKYHVRVSFFNSKNIREHFAKLKGLGYNISDEGSKDGKVISIICWNEDQETL